MNSVPGPAVDVPPNSKLPRWAMKPLRYLTLGELADALGYLERNRPEDDVLGRALAAELARRTAADVRPDNRQSRRPWPRLRLT